MQLKGLYFRAKCSSDHPYLIEGGKTGKKTPVDLTKIKIHKALAHPSPHTGDVSGESYAECPVALEGHNWTRDPPGKGGDLFFGRSPLTPPKSKGDQLLPYKLETTFVRAQVEKRDDATLAEVRRPSCFDQHRLGGRGEKLTQNVPRNGHRTRLRPLFPNADAQTCIPFRLAKRSSGPPGREDPGV